MRIVIASLLMAATATAAEFSVFHIQSGLNHEPGGKLNLGSATIIGVDADYYYAATNYHTVGHRYLTKAYGRGVGPLTVKRGVSRYCANCFIDARLIRIPVAEAPTDWVPAYLNLEPVKVGQTLKMVTHRRARLYEETPVTVQEVNDNGTFYFLPTVKPGDSGGALLDEAGRCRGMVSWESQTEINHHYQSYGQAMSAKAIWAALVDEVPLEDMIAGRLDRKTTDKARDCCFTGDCPPVEIVHLPGGLGPQPTPGFCKDLAKLVRDQAKVTSETAKLVAQIDDNVKDVAAFQVGSREIQNNMVGSINRIAAQVSQTQTAIAELDSKVDGIQFPGSPSFDEHRYMQIIGALTTMVALLVGWIVGGLGRRRHPLTLPPVIADDPPPAKTPRKRTYSRKKSTKKKDCP